MKNDSIIIMLGVLVVMCLIIIGIQIGTLTKIDGTSHRVETYSYCADVNKFVSVQHPEYEYVITESNMATNIVNIVHSTTCRQGD